MHPIATGFVGKVIQDKKTLSCDSAEVAYGTLAETIGLALQIKFFGGRVQQGLHSCEICRLAFCHNMSLRLKVCQHSTSETS